MSSKNYKIYLLSILLLVNIMSPLVSVARAPISNVSFSSIDDRLSQLERVSNAYSQLLTQLQQQVSNNQRDIELISGRVQESQYQLSQVFERQKQLYQQINSLNNHLSSCMTDSSQESINNIVNQDKVVGISRKKDANSDYHEAVALMLEKKQYEQAIRAFQNFVKLYPNSSYQSNANYWLGQLNYNKGQKDDAAYYFAMVVKYYPQSSKAANALLKLGIIMQEKGEKDKAKVAYQQIGKLYPSADAAKYAQKRLATL